MLELALVTALVLRFYIILMALARWTGRDALGLVQLSLAVVTAVVLSRTLFHIDVRIALASACLAEIILHGREFLDVAADLCKTRVLERVQRRRN